MSQDPPPGWQPPTPGPPEPPSYGAPSGPSYGPPYPPPYHPPQPSPTYPPPGWQGPAPGAAPPGHGYGYGQPPPAFGRPLAPKPGVIPLRPLALGEILDGAVQTIRQNPKVMLGLSAAVNAVTALIAFVLQAVAVRSLAGGLDSSASSDVALGDFASASASFLTLVLQTVVTTVLTGLLVVAVSEAVLGRRPSPGEVWARGRGRIWALLGLSILVGLALFAVIGGGVAVSVLLGVLLAHAGSTAIGVILAVLGVFAALALAAWIGVRWLFAPPALLLEKIGIGSALGRSWRLVQGSWWRCFGIWLLALVLASVVGAVLKVPFAIAGAVIGLSSGGSGAGGLAFLAISLLGGAIASTLTAPFSAAILALLYIDLRMRREGLDVTLQRAAAQPGGPGPGPAGPGPAAPGW